MILPKQKCCIIDYFRKIMVLVENTICYKKLNLRVLKGGEEV